MESAGGSKRVGQKERAAAESAGGRNRFRGAELSFGNPWDGEIKQELDEMDIFVPLVSPDFFSSWYIQNVELPRAEDRHGDGEILVVPIWIYEANLREKCAF